MKYAYSLESSRIVRATSLIKSSSGEIDLLHYAQRQYVCPECFQPVFPRGAGSNLVSPHFSHFEKGINSPDCLVRSVNKNHLEKLSPLDFVKKAFSKSDFAHAYISCASAYILNSLSSIIGSYCGDIPLKIGSIRLRNDNSCLHISFLKSTPDFYFSPVDSLNRLVGSSSSSILSEIASLIFASDSDNYSHSKSASCGHLLSPLLRDILDAGGYLGSEKYLLSPEMHQSLLGFAYMNLVNAPSFASLRKSLILSALIETLFRYNLGSAIELDGEHLRILLPDEARLKSLPYPIFKSIQALSLVLRADPLAGGILQDASALQAISNRVMRFISLLKFESLNTTQLEKVVLCEKDGRSGFVYIAYSPDLEKIYDRPNIVKIGRSINPLRREIDLTGQMLREPVTIQRAFRVKDQVLAESFIFESLSKFRFSPAREIFSLSVERACHLVHKLLSENGLLAPHS